MIDFLANLDTEIFLFFNSFHTPFLDRMMMLFTGRFIWIPMYAAVLFIFARPRHWKLLLVFTAAAATAIALTDQTCATLIRPIVERLRPSNLQNPLSEQAIVVDGYRGGSYGFPSCHAANSFALTVFLLCVVRRRWFSIFIVCWAVLNSYSRLYLGVHYPGDLFVGAVIGSLIGYLCYRIAEALTHGEGHFISEYVETPLFGFPVVIQISPALRMRMVYISPMVLMIAIGLITTVVIVALSIV